MRNRSSDKGPFEKLRQEHDGRLRFRVSIVALEDVVFRHVALKRLDAAVIHCTPHQLHYFILNNSRQARFIFLHFIIR
jgi:hypothetical protein